MLLYACTPLSKLFLLQTFSTLDEGIIYAHKPGRPSQSTALSVNLPKETQSIFSPLLGETLKPAKPKKHTHDSSTSKHTSAHILHRTNGNRKLVQVQVYITRLLQSFTLHFRTLNLSCHLGVQYTNAVSTENSTSKCLAAV